MQLTISTIALMALLTSYAAAVPTPGDPSACVARCHQGTYCICECYGGTVNNLFGGCDGAKYPPGHIQ